jgi:hypothetical protein
LYTDILVLLTSTMTHIVIARKISPCSILKALPLLTLCERFFLSFSVFYSKKFLLRPSSSINNSTSSSATITLFDFIFLYFYLEVFGRTLKVVVEGLSLKSFESLLLQDLITKEGFSTFFHHKGHEPVMFVA